MEFHTQDTYYLMGMEGRTDGMKEYPNTMSPCFSSKNEKAGTKMEAHMEFDHASVEI